MSNDTRKFSFEKIETTRDGVECFHTDATDGFVYIAAPGTVPHVIRYKGKAYLAGCVVAAITGDTWVRCDLRFGPGGRRAYVQITEKLIEEIGNPYERQYPTKDQLIRRQRIQDFAVALIDFLA